MVLLALAVPQVAVSDKAVSAVKSTVATAGVICPPLLIGLNPSAPVADPTVGAVADPNHDCPLPINVPAEPLVRVVTKTSNPHIAAVTPDPPVIAADLQITVPATPPQ